VRLRSFALRLSAAVAPRQHAWRGTGQDMKDVPGSCGLLPGNKRFCYSVNARCSPVRERG
jgi:hypothetical protein